SRTWSGATRSSGSGCTSGGRRGRPARRGCTDVPSRRPPAKPPRKPARTTVPTRTVQALERQVARLSAALEAERHRHAKQLESARRAADRRLAAMVKEIAALRHHEARAEERARRLGESQARLEGGREGRPTTASTEALTRDLWGEEPRHEARR